MLSNNIRLDLISEIVPANSFLFAGTIPANLFLFAGTVPANSLLFAGTVPANSFLFAGSVPANNLFHKFIVISYQKMCIVFVAVNKSSIIIRQTLRSLLGPSFKNSSTNVETFNKKKISSSHLVKKDDFVTIQTATI